jgi:hypothetical protein
MNKILRQPNPSDYYDEMDPKGMTSSEYAHYVNDYADYKNTLEKNQWCLTSEQLDDVKVKAKELSELNPNWRKGQALFNALYAYHPQVANMLRGGIEDPFHMNDDLTPVYDRLLGKKTKLSKKEIEFFIEQALEEGLIAFWDTVTKFAFDNDVENDEFLETVRKKLKNDL